MSFTPISFPVPPKKSSAHLNHPPEQGPVHPESRYWLCPNKFHVSGLHWAPVGANEVSVGRAAYGEHDESRRSPAPRLAAYESLMEAKRWTQGNVGMELKVIWGAVLRLGSVGTARLARRDAW
jgi:hypothetical protein